MKMRYGTKLKICLSAPLAVVCAIALAAGMSPGAASIAQESARSKSARATLSMVRKPMPPVPQDLLKAKQAGLDFFFVSQSDERKDLLSIKILLQLKTMKDVERLHQEDVLLKNEIYHFLMKQHPEKNAFRYWQRYIERNLREELAKTHPDISITALIVDHFERL